MADRYPETDLAQRLSEAGATLDYPPTPDLAPAVRQRLATGRGRPPVPSPATRWRTAFALALALLIVVALLGAFPATRRAIAERLGLRNVAIVVTVVPTRTVMPAATPATMPTVPSTATLSLLAGLGAPATLAAAEARVGFPVRPPDTPGFRAPDAVYIGTPPPGGRVALVYRARPALPALPDSDVGLLLTAFRGGLDAGLFVKAVPPGTQIEPVQVRGAQGYWIAGGLRTFLYKDANGTVVQDTVRVAGNTLLWERDGIVYRMETSLSRDEALGIAATVP